MNIKTAVISVIVGIWLIGLLLSQGTGKNYDNETPTQRPIDKFLETAKPDPNNSGYNDYDDPFGDPGSDYEIEEGINTP